MLTIALNPTKTARRSFDNIARYQSVDVLQSPYFRSRARSWRVSAGVSVPSEAWCVLQGASPCRVRASHPPVASVASVAESCGDSSTNKTGEAYTANRAGRRGIRVP